MLSELHKMSSSQNGIIDFTTLRIRFRKGGSMQYISHLDPCGIAAVVYQGLQSPSQVEFRHAAFRRYAE